jgi:nicotinamide-nucleotide amidase
VGASISRLARQLQTRCVAAPRLTLAVAESLTCGHLQAAIGAVSGASRFFLGGLTAYTTEQKARHLGVDREEAERCAAVSPAIAARMAAGACRLFASDIGAATTGFAEPVPESGVHVPVAYFAIARRAGRSIRILREGRVDGPGLARVAMQRAVVREVLAALDAVVKEERRREAGACRVEVED